MSASAAKSAPTETLLWERQPDGSVVCHLCAHRCRIKPGLRGICGVRENREGALVSLVTDRLVTAEIDPIEKKPFFQFLPGSSAYSIATAGCNFHCLYYTGNIPGNERESTACPGCGEVVVRRRGFTVLANRLEGGRCPRCRAAIAGVWE